MDWGNTGNGESNINPPVATGDSTQAISGSVVSVKAASFNVFDMQGRYLGFVKLTSDAHVSEVLKARFHKSGIYLVKRGNFMKRVVVR